MTRAWQCRLIYHLARLWWVQSASSERFLASYNGLRCICIFAVFSLDPTWIFSAGSQRDYCSWKRRGRPWGISIAVEPCRSVIQGNPGLSVRLLLPLLLRQQIRCGCHSQYGSVTFVREAVGSVAGAHFDDGKHVKQIMSYLRIPLLYPLTLALSPKSCLESSEN